MKRPAKPAAKPRPDPEALTFELVPLGELVPEDPDVNPKEHDLAGIRASLQRFGFTEPLFRNLGTGKLVAGNGRDEVLRAMKRDGEPAPKRVRIRRGEWLVPVVSGWFTSQDEAEAYLVASNRLPESGGWKQNLATLLERIRTRTTIQGIGYTQREIERIISRAQARRSGATESEVPAQADRRVKLGEVWKLGRHLLACGDARDAGLWRRLLDGRTADAEIADPPYGMGKVKEGVANDDLYGAKLDAFQNEWWKATRPGLALHAAVYVWGNPLDLWRWWFGGLCELTRKDPITFRNEIVWDKGHGFAQGTENVRCFPPVTERCLFFALGRQGFGSKNSDRYWEGWEPIRTYLEAEFKAAKIDNKRATEITGTRSMVNHWTGKSQWLLISAENYEALRAATKRFRKPYQEIRSTYERLHREWNAWLDQERGYHDVTHDPQATDVWRAEVVRAAERHGHSTPKPVGFAARMIQSSVPVGGLIMVPFGGTGPELCAAEQTGRIAVVTESDPRWCDVMLARWEALTGERAERA